MCLHSRTLAQVDQDAFLAMREEWLQAKQRERAAEDKTRK